MESDQQATVNYKIVAGVFGSIILVLVGIIDRVWSTSFRESAQQLRETDQQFGERISRLETRQIELVEQFKSMARGADDREERLRTLERLYGQFDRRRER
jgi:hypothetical protein